MPGPPAFPPDAIQNLYDTVHAAIPQSQLGGIYANKPGYHNARNQLPSGDYSVQRADDKKGDGWAASALDITLPAKYMKQLTHRLIDATFDNDDRVWCLREFFGTTDGQNVTGLDVRDKRWVTSDPSHLWHIHLSVYRKFATDNQQLQGVAQVLLGKSGTGGDTDDMNQEDTEKMIMQALRNYHLGSDGTGRFTPKKYPSVINDEKNGVADRLQRLEKDNK
jgi:hypothetical protein